MKSERRHELQHNELAEWLFKTGEQLKPHQNLIMAVIAAVAVAIIGYTWWTRHTASRINQGWTELGRAMDAGSPDLFAAIADEYPDTVVGQTAAVLLGDVRLSAACNQRFASATLAQRELKAAQDSYAKVLENNLSETLRERATYGMARVRETDGQLDAAKQLYSDLVTQWPSGAFAAAAKQRLADFKDPETKLMFASLHKYEPKGEFSEEPGSLATPPSAPPVFDVPQEPPVGNAPDDVRKGVNETSEHPFSDALGKGLEEPSTPRNGPDALGNAPVAERGKKPPAAPADEKSADKKKTDAPSKKSQ
jgi:predicted negative regulator of RcsB-dependent stress response